MDPARAANRFGWDGRSTAVDAPLAFVTLSRTSGTAADREVLLGFADPVDALTFADWWGLEGEARFAAYLDRSRQTPGRPRPADR